MVGIRGMIGVVNQTQGSDRMDQKNRPTSFTFLKDVMVCALSSFGGPEAHYGVFSSVLVDKKKYLEEEELTELIGLHALVPGPSSTQTITAVGYHVGGPVLALLTFLIWAMPAIIMMGLAGVFFNRFESDTGWLDIIRYLPATAVAFIWYAGIRLSKKVVKKRFDVLLFLVMLVLGLLLVGISMWVVPILLVAGGLVMRFAVHEDNENPKTAVHPVRPRWAILGLVIGLALVNEGLRAWSADAWVNIYTTFYRFGYSVIGGGQIVIPLMIQELVNVQSALTLSDFLSGYALDQAIPGPLFSFASFVSARASSGTGYAFLLGMIGGLSIFLPGILLVYVMVPLWKSVRGYGKVKMFLHGVTVTAAALIAMTAISQTVTLPGGLVSYAVLILGTAMLMSRKIPAPLVVIFSLLLGILF
jgi:chromate transporter